MENSSLGRGRGPGTRRNCDLLVCACLVHFCYKQPSGILKYRYLSTQPHPGHAHLFIYILGGTMSLWQQGHASVHWMLLSVHAVVADVCHVALCMPVLC